MLPSAIAREARENLLDYLRTTYALTDPVLERALFEHLAGREGLFRGPYLGVRLPFRLASKGAAVPLEIAPPFPPYRHQMRAFERLHGQRGHQPQHTLVTTGTGSGKTECFLYPILDHCWRERSRGKGGIKAILLYPMNALAADQARRLAKVLWDDPRLAGKVNAGLYVGGKGQHRVADREHLIDDRKMLRQAPPDILLTNYKMLDFLLLRPEDRELWEQNGHDTLRFLVLDELHTYDGAQGSDVACLLRRLKGRLGTPAGALCCIGTSATIGEADERSKERLTDFARQIFDEPFFSDSVISEDREEIEEALGRERDLDGHPTKDDHSALDPRGKAPAAWLARQQELWLGQGAGNLSPLELGERLRRHDFLHQLLRVLGGKVELVSDLIEALALREPWFGDLDAEGRALALDSFVALCSHARRPGGASGDDGNQPIPFLAVQVQLWMREVRSLLRAVEAVPRFEWESELGGRRAGGEERGRYLPMVRCRDCGCVGWGAVQRPGESRLRDDTEEREIGRAWIERSPDARFVVLGHGPERVGQRELPEYLCPRCLGLGHEPACACEGSSTPPSLPVRVGRELTTDRIPRFRPICPECGTEDSLVFLASRAASLLSVAVSHLFQTEYNADRKLLAFVDSVQDASHRAGFFGARTYRFNLRAQIQELVQSSGGRLPLAEAGARLLRRAEERRGGARRAVPVLVPEDLRAHPDYERFLLRNGEGEHPELRAWLTVRLSLEVTFEYGYSVRAGRSLEKTGCSTVEVDPERLATAARELALIAGEEGLLQSRTKPISEDEARHFLAGLVNRLRLRGGIHQDLLSRYVENAGNRYFLSRKKNPLGPIFGRESVLPRFLVQTPPTPGRRSAFDAFGGRPGRLTWYSDWATRSLGLASEDDGIQGLYVAALARLASAGVLRRVEAIHQGGPVWGLEPACLTIVDGVSELVCSECRELVNLPASVAGDWTGRPCTKYRCAGRWGEPRPVSETFYTRIFRAGRVARVFPEEHTGLLEREVRERIEEGFKTGRAPDAPNLLVCTPTLEMGIDIGDLSAVLLCGVPPTTAMYLQRIGRAGRATGNALCLTMANREPHDLYFHAEPREMMGGAIDPPGCFLDAPEMLKRQVAAHAMDAWARQEQEVRQIPRHTTLVLAEGSKFPRRFLEHYESHKRELLKEFLDRFDHHTLSDASREELEHFALSDRVAEAVQGAFDEVRRERERLKGLQRKARERYEELEADPERALKDAEVEKQEAQDSHRMLGRLIVALGRRYPLNVLTDAGVLPNYAFPEPGVQLDSVISWEERGQRRYEAHQYMRPASMAIRELAPFNSFYAEGRRVRIDEIDLGTEAAPLVESWRLCAACNHSEREEDAGAPLPGCPACGDARWNDVGQKRSLVYFRRSRSLATRLEAASADEGEDRELAYYQTHDLIDVAAHNRCGARLIESLPFGFELLTRLELRELNFGLERNGSLEVAGRTVNEDGFVVCRDCGRVRPDDGNDPIEHAATCRTRRGRAERVESLYLYRRVTSEAIRLLLPVASLDLEVQQASFKAALELGLRRHFGGRAPHLRVKAMREPIRGGGHRSFLVLFDTVPGGTGFLADLWRGDAMMDVLEDTLTALRVCSCLAAGKDGCYRCLFAHQNQREMESTSSAAARRMLEGIVERRAELKGVPTLSDVVLDSKLESELEERFLRALVARVKSQGMAKKVLKQGEERWEIVAGSKRWEVRPQVELGPAQGVETPCRPDFLFVPLSPEADRRPVAVFCDGFAYHVQPEEPVSRLGDDVDKRRAILVSGRFLVWSVTWDDVGDFEAGSAKKGPSLFDDGHTGAAQTVLKAWKIHADTELAGMGSMELLWSWLRFPDETEWLRRLAAIGVEFLVRRVSLDPPTIPVLERELLAEVQPGGPDPEAVSVGPQSTMFARLESRFGVKLLASVSVSAVRGNHARLPNFSLRLYDDPEHRRDPQFRTAWRMFLQAMDLLQFAEGFAFATTEDILRRRAAGADVYPLARPDDGHSLAAEAPLVEQPQAGPLDDLDLLPRERSVADAVHAACGGLPEVGYELVDRMGRCVAQAALVWSRQKVAVMIDGEPGDADAFLSAGWRVFDAAEVPAIVDAVCGRTTR